MTKEIRREAVSRYGTPLYLYDLDQFRKNISYLREHLFHESTLLFSMKANPLSVFCKIAQENGCGLEIASGGELNLAMKSGILPEQIVFTGPGKTERELAQAVRADVYRINVESIQELRQIEEIAERTGKVVPVALRINPAQRKSTGKVQMSGTASQFGIEETDLTSELFKEIVSLPHICLLGIHLYMGSSILDAEEICRNTEYAIHLGLQLAETHSFQLKYLNAGGGFGIPYFTNEKELDMKLLKRGMRIIEEKYKDRLSDTRVYFESGRYLLAECGLFLIRVLYRKQSKGNTYLVCDGGANFHASSAFLGRFVRQNFPMHVLGKEGRTAEFYVTGPSCTPTDLIGQKVWLPEHTDVGDIIVIEKSGAYGLTYSPYGFLNHPLPAEVGYEEEKGFCILGEDRDK